MSLNDRTINEGATEWWLSEVKLNEERRKAQEKKHSAASSYRAEQKSRRTQRQNKIFQKGKTQTTP